MSYLLTATENVSNNWWMTELLPLSESLITLTGGPQMSLPPNRVQTNRVWVVRHRNRPNLDWRVLAKDADEAKRTVLADEPRLAYERLTAEEARP